MTPLRDVTIAARVPLDLRTDLEAVRDRLKSTDPAIDLSRVIRRACTEFVDRELARGPGSGPGGLLSPAEANIEGGARRLGRALGRLDTEPATHVHDPATSKAAARAAWPKAGRRRRKVLDALLAAGNEGRTADELDQELDLPNYDAARALNEVKRAGWAEAKRELRDTPGGEVRREPVRRRTRRGNMADVYVLTPAAVVRLANENRAAA